jgi:carbamoyltransferase
VAHVDGSGRLQTVSAATNLRYHRLIEAFRALTGIPMVLNTSFNENEPVVCKPEEALNCFLRTKISWLSMTRSFHDRPRLCLFLIKPQLTRVILARKGSG